MLTISQGSNIMESWYSKRREVELSCAYQTVWIIHSGWGRTGIGMPAADILQQAIMPIADHNICDRTAGLPVIEEVMVCAGGQGKAGGCKVHVKGAL